MAYIVKINTPASKYTTTENGYLSGNGHITKQLENATRFIRREAAEISAGAYNVGHKHKVAIVLDEKNIIGTYFSTYTGKHLNKITIKKIIENIICIPLCILLSPIVGFIMLKEKIFPPKYMNEYP